MIERALYAVEYVEYLEGMHFALQDALEAADSRVERVEQALKRVQNIARTQVELTASCRRELAALLREYRPDDPRLTAAHLNAYLNDEYGNEVKK